MLITSTWNLCKGFIGVSLDFSVAKSCPPQEGFLVILLRILQHRLQPNDSIQRMLGLIISTTIVFPYGKLCMWMIQLWFLRVFSVSGNSQSKRLNIWKVIAHYLYWWKKWNSLLIGVSSYRCLPKRLKLSCCPISVGGVSSQQERLLHINVIGLKGVHSVLLVLYFHVSGKTFLWQLPMH